MQKFETSDGTAIAYYRWGEQHPGPPVVLHHGFAASTQLNWVGTGLVQALLDAGRSILAVDARGHGASDKPRAADRYGEPRMARDLLELIDHLAIETFDLFGYSMGAVVSLLVASQDARVQRLLIGGVGEGVVVSGGVDMRVMDRQALVDALLTQDPAGITNPGAALFRQFAEYTGADLHAIAAQAKSMHATPIALEHINAPTLLIAGEADVLAVHPERLTAAIPGAHCKQLPGDHLTVLRHPLFAASAVQFLNA